MAGKGQIGTEVTKKKERLLDLKKEKEKVKFLSGLLAEMVAVQTELIEDVDTNLNPDDLLLKCDQLRALSIQWALLDSMTRGYVDRMLALFVADEDKGNS